MILDNVAKNQKVILIRAARTIKKEHPEGNLYRVLGFQGTLVRLSRVGDCEKLIITADYFELAGPEAAK